MEEDPQASSRKFGKQHNILPIWGNEATMNLNPLILANIQSSSYFKVHLFKLKTYHEVVDEIYYQVKHMEPWERGSRKTAGQTGMCGGVRGVGAGGIVSTAYCLLYKLYTLRLTRKQVNGLLNHADSPYIRALGFMYLRYTQPPADLYDWYTDYLLDEEEIDVKAGGGQVITIGQMVFQFMTKLEWYSTLFPRIPVPIQKQIEKKLEQFCHENQISLSQLATARTLSVTNTDDSYNRRNDGPSTSRDNAPTCHYRSEHDNRDYSSSTSNITRRKDLSPLQSRHSRNQHEHEHSSRHRHNEKHKKSHKRRHHSRSHSRSRSRSGTRNESKHKKRDRDRDYSDKRYR